MNALHDRIIESQESMDQSIDPSRALGRDQGSGEQPAMLASRNPLEQLGVRELDKGLASFRARELRRAAREILLTEKKRVRKIGR